MSNSVVAIVQARMGSTRLPGKSMKLLAGKPLLQRVIERIKKAEKINEIILAIPDTSENLVLEELGKKLDIKVYKGSENDLVNRYVNAAKLVKSDFVVRIPADNPVPQGSEIDRIINHHLQLGRPGFSSNLAEIFQSGYPDGIGAEIFDTSYLDEIKNDFSRPDKREHVHLNFFNYTTQTEVDENWCPVSTIKCPSNFARPDLVLDVNTGEQFIFMSKLYEYLYPRNPSFGIEEIVEWYDNHYMINPRIEN